MQVVTEADPARFLDRVSPWLETAPAENQLLLDIATRVVMTPPERPAVLVYVERAGQVEAVALATPPRPLIVSRADEEATRRLAEHLASTRADLAGVLGPRESADAFAKAWTASTARSPRLQRIETLYELRLLTAPTPPAGRLRRAEDGDV